jgi:hypothetical protein
LARKLGSHDFRIASEAAMVSSRRASARALKIGGIVDVELLQLRARTDLVPFLNL